MFRRIFRESEFSIKLLISLSFIFILIGIIIIIIFSININNVVQFGVITTEDAILNGVIGDFIGGVVGTLFSLAGSVLFVVTVFFQFEQLQIESDNSRMQLFQIQVLTLINQRTQFIQTIEYESEL